MSAEGEIEREARRVFRKLMAPGAHLVRHGAEAWRLVSREELNAARIAPLGAATVEAFVRREGIAGRDGALGILQSAQMAAHVEQKIAQPRPGRSHRGAEALARRAAAGKLRFLYGSAEASQKIASKVWSRSVSIARADSAITVTCFMPSRPNAVRRI